MCDGVAGCNTTQCLWDAGDCGDVLSAVLLATVGDGDKAAELASKVGELVAEQGGYTKQAMYAGIVLGLSIALCALIVSPAQVYCVGAVVDAIIVDEELSRAQLSAIYGAAALLSAPVRAAHASPGRI